MTFYSTITVIIFLSVILTNSTSKYKGVNWVKRCNQWRASIILEKKFKQGGMYDDELDAAKRVNQMCDEFQIKRKNPNIDASPQPKIKHGISEYKGVFYHVGNSKWAVDFKVNKKRHYGGYFDEQIEAAKRVNQLCDELGIPRKNPEVNAIPNPKIPSRTTSQYKAVSWNTNAKKWAVYFTIHKHTYYGGYFDEEIEAAKKVNQLCDELGIKQKNPQVHAMSKQKNQQKNNLERFYKIEQEDIKKLKRNLKLKNVIKEFKRKRMQLLDEEEGDTESVLDEQNISEKTSDDEIFQPSDSEDGIALPDYGAAKKECEILVKILDENSDPVACLIKENLIAFINYGEQTIMTEINLRTKNGESALSIAAKHGFSNAVKFLISKGAEKEHFTNDHYTPLSLAVSQNHLKVVQVLFEEWISPNSHEKPYLHLLPIFNVKSREIAQLLIDNDAQTHDLYNNKHQSPLTVACQNGHLDVIEFFLDDGLNMNHLDNDNKTPLFYALANKLNITMFLNSKRSI